MSLAHDRYSINPNCEFPNMEKGVDIMKLRPWSPPATPCVYLEHFESHKKFRISACLRLQSRVSESMFYFHGSSGFLDYFISKNRSVAVHTF